MSENFVKWATQAKANILSYEENIDSVSLAFALFGYVKSWYVFDDEGLHFGPARFIAYNDYDLTQYAEADETSSESENDFMSKWVEKAADIERNDLLAKLTQQYSALGKKPNSDADFYIFR